MTKTAHAFVVVNLALDEIVEGKQNPRKFFDKAKLEELAQSIGEKGVIEPILVRPASGQRRFEIVAGARRYRASVLADQTTIPAIVRELSDVEAIELAVTENEQRVDVNPMEQAEGYSMLLRIGKGYTPASIAKRMGRPESFVVRRVKLLGLEAWLQDALREGRLSVGHAEALLRLSPAQRKEATDLRGGGVVWNRSLLLDPNEKWIPTADDLQPLNELEHFIRQKSQFDPGADVSRHLVPGFGEQLQLAEKQQGSGPSGDLEDEDNDVDDGPVAETLVAITFDSMVRSRIGKASGTLPLTPSNWRAVKPGKECAHTQLGVVTQGTERYGQIFNICRKRSCAKHWPATKKKAKTAPPSASTRATTAKPQESYEEKRKREQAFNRAVIQTAAPLLVEHTAKMKFSADVVRAAVGTHNLGDIAKTFGVKLTDANATQVLVLSTLQPSDYYLDNFRRECQAIEFNLSAVEQQVKKATAQKAEEAAAEAKAVKPSADAKPAKKAKKGGAR